MISALQRSNVEVSKDSSPPPVIASRESIPKTRPKIETVVQACGDVVKEGEPTVRHTSAVGFAGLPNQIHQKAVSRGFTFNLMVTGSPGLGKASFINSLFCSDIYNTDYPTASKRSKTNGTRVDSKTFVLRENGVKLRLTILDTPGFGQAVDNSECWAPIVACIEERFEEYLRAELNVYRTTVGSGAIFMPNLPNDTRVHACIYFITPTGHGLHQIDIETLKSLHEKVNLIVVIGKADTLTPDECASFKQTISRELTEHGIRLYMFPESVACLADDKTMMTADVQKWRKRQPFAVVCSDRLIQEASGRKIRGRVYPWGVVETENLAHNDFIALKNLLLNVHLHDLLHETHIRLYANYYATRLRSIAEASKFPVDPDGREPLSQLEAERMERQRQLAKLEADMEAVFEQKVNERTVKLNESEREMEQRMSQLTQQFSAELAEFDHQKRIFDQERSSWEADNRDALQMLQCSLDKLSAKEKGRSKRKGLL